MIKLLIVEDSKVAQEFLQYIFSSDPEIQVIGIANNGEEAVDMAVRMRPHVITMDLHMPKLDGLGATRKIMETCPTPIVIVSGNPNVKEAAFTFRLIEAGALAVVLRPPGIGDPEYQAASRSLIQTVKSMSEIRVVTRIKRVPPIQPSMRIPEKPMEALTRDIRIVAIGASTGGPRALENILSGLPKDFPVPILIVQHIAPGFVGGLVQWLEDVTAFPVHVAVNGGYPLPGHVYVAPDSKHLGVNGGAQIVLSDRAPEGNLRPSVSYLFRSVAETIGSHAVGVLLTGMGRDGSQELKTMKDSGSITIAQDEASSVVFGMPGEAVKLDAANYILPPEGIAAFLTTLVKKKIMSPLQQK